MSEIGNREDGNGVVSFAERLANSISYRMNLLASQRRKRRGRELYLQSGKRPFSPGYHHHKWNFIANAVADGPLLERFRRGAGLPEGYGLRLDERAVEYPWLFSRLLPEPGTLLDAGSVLNFKQLIELPVLKDKNVHIVTLAPEGNCFWKRGVSYTFADLRNLPMRDGLYDDIVCLSTLEHVGLNNEIYTNVSVDSTGVGDYRLAARELWRVLKPGGHLYLSVPFGKPSTLDWLQQFDSEMCERLINLLGASVADTSFYRYTSTGWNISNGTECRGAEYTDPARWGVQFSNHSDNRQLDRNTIEETPAAAGAVVCIDFIK